MISIPEARWAAMLDAFATSPDGYERVAYLDGIRWRDRTGEHGVVTTVVIPDAQLTPGNYRVPAPAIAQAGTHLFEYKLVRLLQVHTHGGIWTNHSAVDDAKAYSGRDGAVSIVLPEHATHRPSPAAGGVHILQNGTWIRVPENGINDVVRMIPSYIDFRPATPSIGLRWLSGIWRRLSWSK